RLEPHHPTAEEVFQAVRRDIPNLSLATVYKTLDTLVASGLVAKLSDAAGTARYDARREDHYHLRCLRTGLVRDLPTPHDPNLLGKLDPDLIDSLGREGFKVTGYRLELVGFFDSPGEPSRHDDRPDHDPS